jgi:hypothetical protein
MSSPRRWRSSLRIVVAEKVDTLTAALRQDAAHDGSSDSPAAAEMHPNGDELLCAAGRPTTGPRGGRRAGGFVAVSRRHTVRSPSPSSDVAARTTALDSRADQDTVRRLVIGAMSLALRPSQNSGLSDREPEESIN